MLGVDFSSGFYYVSMSDSGKNPGGGLVDGWAVQKYVAILSKENLLEHECGPGWVNYQIYVKRR